jgi:SAM-dependent methyltransferase
MFSTEIVSGLHRLFALVRNHESDLAGQFAKSRLFTTPIEPHPLTLYLCTMKTRGIIGLSWGCLASLFLELIGCPGVLAESGPTNTYEQRVNHDPNGTGKFYLGREIALIMGHAGAAWLERDEREFQENPAALIEALKLREGQHVADFGAGTGYYTRRLAASVGPEGVVYAVDIQQEMLDLLTNRLSSAGIRNVRPILGTLQDPKLPLSSVDLVLMVDVYHELEFPREIVTAISRALKPGGRLVLVEFRAEDPRVPIKEVHKMSEAQVKKELALEPLKWVKTDSRLPWQHILFFEKQSEP